MSNTTILSATVPAIENTGSPFSLSRRSRNATRCRVINPSCHFPCFVSARVSIMRDNSLGQYLSGFFSALRILSRVCVSSFSPIPKQLQTIRSAWKLLGSFDLFDNNPILFSLAHESCLLRFNQHLQSAQS